MANVANTHSSAEVLVSERIRPAAPAKLYRPVSYVHDSRARVTASSATSRDSCAVELFDHLVAVPTGLGSR